MKMEVRSGSAPGSMEFVILKSYDGGRKWERARQFGDFATATDAAQALRAQHPSIRFRVDVERRRPRR